MSLVNLKTYNTSPEAEIFRIFLEDNGVKAFVFDTNSSTVYPMLNDTLGGYQLKVQEQDFEKAEKLMDEFYDEDDSKKSES